MDKDIDRAGEALAGANAGRIHTFIATSPIHMEKKLHMTPDQVVEQAVRAVQRARRYTDDVEFSPEDAGRCRNVAPVRIESYFRPPGAARVPAHAAQRRRRHDALFSAPAPSDGAVASDHGTTNDAATQYFWHKEASPGSLCLSAQA
jgi:hypothetical protein